MSIRYAQKIKNLFLLISLFLGFAAPTSALTIINKTKKAKEVTINFNTIFVPKYSKKNISIFDCNSLNVEVVAKQNKLFLLEKTTTLSGSFNAFGIGAPKITNQCGIAILDPDYPHDQSSLELKHKDAKYKIRFLSPEELTKF